MKRFLGEIETLSIKGKFPLNGFEDHVTASVNDLLLKFYPDELEVRIGKSSQRKGFISLMEEYGGQGSFIQQFCRTGAVNYRIDKYRSLGEIDQDSIDDDRVFTLTNDEAASNGGYKYAKLTDEGGRSFGRTDMVDHLFHIRFDKIPPQLTSFITKNGEDIYLLTRKEIQ